MAAIVFPTDPDRLDYVSAPWSDPLGKQWTYEVDKDRWNPYLSSSVPGGGSGTVTAVSVTTDNGVSGSVATSTTTPAITITLGAITPTSVAASGNVTGLNLSGTNTGDQTTVTGNAGTVTTINGRISAGTNVTLSGSGTAASPYVINASGGGGSGDALVANNLDQFADVTHTPGATLAIAQPTTLAGGTHSGTNTGDQDISAIAAAKALWATAADDGKLVKFGSDGTLQCGTGFSILDSTTGFKVDYVHDTNLTANRYVQPANASGYGALTQSLTGVPDALTNGTISGTVAFGTGADTNMRNALGLGTGDAVQHAAITGTTGTFTNTTASSSPATGAVTVAGGIGAKESFFETAINIKHPSFSALRMTANSEGFSAYGKFWVYNTSESTSTSSGGIQTTGGIGVAKSIVAGGTIKTGGYTVATLPTPTTGMRCYITDGANSPVYMAAAAGGGTTYTPVFYNGSAWVNA